LIGIALLRRAIGDDIEQGCSGALFCGLSADRCDTGYAQC
jgi:hypothetical protein